MVEDKDKQKPTKKVVEVIPTVKMGHIGKEGLIKRDGKTVHDDSWLHADIMEDEEHDQSLNRRVNSMYRTNKEPDRAEKSEHLIIDLTKSRLDRGKLVKRPVQVKGKNGKVFTRMQWVDPKTGMPASDAPESSKPMTREDYLNSHVKNMSTRDKDAELEKHKIEWKRHDSPQRDRINAIEALKEHYRKNPHLIGADKYQDTSEQDAEGTDRVQSFYDRIKDNGEFIYKLMNRFGITDQSDPRQNKDDKMAPMKHMRLCMQLKAYLKENPHLLSELEDETTDVTGHKPMPPQPKDPVKPVSRAQQGGNTVKGILDGMDSKELYTLMSQHGIADVDPRTVQEWVDNKTAPIRHMRNMMALRKLIEQNPSILNIGEDGGLSDQEKERLASRDEQEKNLDRAQKFIGEMPLEWKKGMVRKYADHPTMKARTVTSNDHVNQMHEFSALKKILAGDPKLMDSLEKDYDKEQLKKVHVGNKMMGKIIRHFLGLKGVGDVKQHHNGSDLEYEFGESSFARIEEDDDGNRYISVVDTGKDGEGWDEYQIPMDKATKFMNGEEVGGHVEEVPLHKKPPSVIIQALNDDFASNYSKKVLDALTPHLRESYKQADYVNNVTLLADVSGLSKNSFLALMEKTQVPIRSNGTAVRVDDNSHNWGKLMLGHLVTPSKTMNANDYIVRANGVRPIMFGLWESAKQWDGAQRAEARKDFIHSGIGERVKSGDSSNDTEHEKTYHMVREALADPSKRKQMVDHLHLATQHVPFDLMTEMMAHGTKFTFGLDLGKNHCDPKDGAVCFDHSFITSDHVMSHGHPSNVKPHNASWSLMEVASHEFGHAVDWHLSGRTGQWLEWDDSHAGKKYAGKWTKGVNSSYIAAVKESNPDFLVKLNPKGKYIYHPDEWVSAYEGRIYGRGNNHRDPDQGFERVKDRPGLARDTQFYDSKKGIEHWSEASARFAQAHSAYLQARSSDGDNYSFDEWCKRCHDNLKGDGYETLGRVQQHNVNNPDEPLYDVHDLLDKGNPEYFGFVWHRMKETHPKVVATANKVYNRSDFLDDGKEAPNYTEQVQQNKPDYDTSDENYGFTRKSEVSLILHLEGDK